MSVAVARPSGTVHPFPLRTEARDRLHRRHAELATAPVVYEGGWYHQEAIEEAARADGRPIDRIGH